MPFSDSNPRDARKRRATSSDVARESGVSRTTVSYVLNGALDRSISEHTRAHVLETAARLGHVPSASARALRSGRMDLVLVVAPGFSLGYVFDLTIDRLNRELSQRGFGTLLTRLDERNEAGSLRTLWGVLSPHIVLAMGGLTAEGREFVEDSDATFVDDVGILSHPEIGRMQARHFLETGHTRLGFAYPADANLERYARQRLDGARETCGVASLPAPDVQTISSDLEQVRSVIEGWRAAGVTAICAHNDDIALIVMAGLTSMGLRAGLDLAIIGSDDIPTAGLGLSTVAVDIPIYSDGVVRSVLAALDGDETPPRHQADALRLILRDTA